MIRVPPRSTLTETLFPDTTRFRSRLQGGAKFPTGGRRGASTRPRASPRALPRFASPSQAPEGQQIRSDAGADGWKRHASSQSGRKKTAARGPAACSRMPKDVFHCPARGKRFIFTGLIEGVGRLAARELPGGDARARKSLAWGKRVSVRVNIGGRTD